MKLILKHEDIETDIHIKTAQTYQLPCIAEAHILTHTYTQTRTYHASDYRYTSYLNKNNVRNLSVNIIINRTGVFMLIRNNNMLFLTDFPPLFVEIRMSKTKVISFKTSLTL